MHERHHFITYLTFDSTNLAPRASFVIFIEEDPAEGIVIRLYPSREADLVLKVISPRYGKITFLAKHARRSKKRFGTTFDLFDKGVFTLASGKGSMLLVDSFAPSIGYRKIRDDLTKISAGSLVCEAADLLTQENEGENIELFHTLDLTLRAIDDSLDVKQTLRALYLGLGTLLSTAGFGVTNADEAPSARRLVQLLQQVEESTGRRLESKGPILDILIAMKKDG